MTRKPRQKSLEVAREEVPESSQTENATIPTADPDPSSKPVMLVASAKSHDYKTTYANHAKVGISQWDFTIIFGQSLENKESQNIAEEFIAIKFSPQYFKNLANSLVAAVQQWEATFGELRAGLGQNFNIPGMEAAFEGLKNILENAERQAKP